MDAVDEALALAERHAGPSSEIFGRNLLEVVQAPKAGAVEIVAAFVANLWQLQKSLAVVKEETLADQLLQDDYAGLGESHAEVIAEAFEGLQHTPTLVHNGLRLRAQVEVVFQA